MASSGNHKVPASFDRDAVLRDLDDQGYAVIPEVCSAQDCDVYVSQYRNWLSQFTEEERPYQFKSIMKGYGIANFETTWNARLKAKPVFASIWETEKLLTSVDAVAIYYPPEMGKSGEFNTGSTWFHLDYTARRSGLHCYQGALYLEEATENDHCFRVMRGSHKHVGEFYEKFPDAARRSLIKNETCMMEKEDMDWFKSKGCVPTKVPVPKGGMVLWDSRTFHDNCFPEKNRPNSNRWRFVVFVCMTPAFWARPEDMAERKRAYRNNLMTSHWPSQGINVIDYAIPSTFRQVKSTVSDQLPEVARTKESRLMVGDLEYNFDDGEPNGPNWRPVWREVATG